MKSKYYQKLKQQQLQVYLYGTDYSMSPYEYFIWRFKFNIRQNVSFCSFTFIFFYTKIVFEMPYVTICKKCLIMLKHDVQSKFRNVFEARMQNKFLGFFCYDDRIMIFYKIFPPSREHFIPELGVTGSISNTVHLTRNWRGRIASECNDTSIMLNMQTSAMVSWLAVFKLCTPLNQDVLSQSPVFISSSQ